MLHQVLGKKQTVSADSIFTGIVELLDGTIENNAKLYGALYDALQAYSMYTPSTLPTRRLGAGFRCSRGGEATTLLQLCVGQHYFQAKRSSMRIPRASRDM